LHPELIQKLNKKWYIMHRCLIFAKQILLNKTLKVWLPNDSEERNFLCNIREGKFNHAELMTLFDNDMQQIENLLKTTDIPDNPSIHTKLFEDWIYNLRSQTIPGFTKPIVQVLPSQAQNLLSLIPFQDSSLLFLAIAKDEKEKYTGVFTNSLDSLS